MIERFLQRWKDWSLNGLHVPFIHDSSTNKPSITLAFPYITFILSIISIVSLHFNKDLFVATATTLMFWLVSTVLYMIRRITKAKIDLDDRAIELDGGDDEDAK